MDTVYQVRGKKFMGETVCINHLKRQSGDDSTAVLQEVGLVTVRSLSLVISGESS